MNDHKKISIFLDELRKFLSERVIYESLCALPEDIFDVEDYITVPVFENDEEVRGFIDEHGFEDSDNIVRFFLDQYMDKLNDIIDDIVASVGNDRSCSFYDLDYDYDLVFAG